MEAPKPARIRIAHVVHQLSLAGAEVLVVELSRRLRERGGGGRYEFAFICLDRVGPVGERLRGEGFKVVGLGRRPGVDWTVARRMAGVLADWGVDVVHAHQYTPFFYAAVARVGPLFWRGGGRGPAILFTEHGRHYPDVRRWRRVVANRVLLRRGDRVTAVGQFVKEALVRNEGLAADRVEVVYNGIDVGRFALGERERTASRVAVREGLGVGPDQPVVLQVARFHGVKDHGTGVRAFARAWRVVPRAVLVLVGNGEARGEAERLVGKLGVGGAVRFLGVREDVPGLMAAADVFMLSSLSEGVSVTLLEAMAAGLPIVATDVGGNREVVVEGETGLLSLRGDAGALGENLAELMRDGGRRMRMGQAGRGRVFELFDQRKMHDRYAELYEQMGGGRG